MKIIDRYLLREIGLSFLAVTLVLALMFLSGTFVRLLAETLEGRYPADLLMTLFALRGVGSMVLLLPFAMFLAVMLALGRFYRDSEMAVLAACGHGPAQLLRPVALAGVVVAVLVGVLALAVAPWAEDRAMMVVDEAGARVGVEGIAAGQFNQLDNGSVVYVEDVDPASKELYGIFALFQGPEGSMHLTAQRGEEYLDRASGDRYVLLRNGYRYEGEHGQGAFRITRFEQHGLRIQERAVVPTARRLSANSSAELWQGGRAELTELQWRLAMPLSTLLLALLAVPLSKSAPRQGRLFGMFLGVLVYMGYNNLLNIARSAMARGDVPIGLGLWWVHLSVALLVVGMLWYQLRMRGPKASKVAR